MSGPDTRHYFLVKKYLSVWCRDLTPFQINTNLTSNFRGSNDLTQSGNAIGDADWRASMKLDVINGDGWKNVAMAGLVTDFNNPARQTISPYETFAKDLGHEVSALESGFANSSAGQSLWNSTQLNVNLSNLANSSINARTFVNIDPVVLDLNGDGVKLTSYNDSQVTFDVDNDGKQERTGWVSSQDGILVHDKNQDGKINNITETISEFCLRVKLCETKTPTPIATPKIETRSMIKSQICCIATYKKTRVRLKSKNFPTTSLSVYEKFPYLNNINSIFKPEHNQQQRKKVSGPDTRHYFLVKKYLSVRCRDLTPFLDTFFTVHREIMRNLHKIVGITKSDNGEYIAASGIKDGKLFDTKDKNFLKQILDSKSNVKFYSFFDEVSGNYQEFYIPIKNYNLIKDHLLVLDKDSKRMVKGRVSSFAISFSAMLHLIFPEVIGKVRPMENKQFPWIEEISSTPYYSTIHPLSRFVAKDNVINDPLLMMGYGYPSRMFKSNVLLARILQETNILPKNFSIIPTIEKSLKSGNREYCGTISTSNPKGLLIVEKLHGKEFKVSKTYMKYCFDKSFPNKNRSIINGGVREVGS